MIVPIARTVENGDEGLRRPRRSIALPFLRRPVQLGDAIRRATDTAGVPHCNACAERQRRLNELFEFVPRGRG